MEKVIFTIGFHKGELDFGVNSDIRELDYEQMKKFREAMCVGIGQAETIWRGSRSKSPGFVPHAPWSECIGDGCTHSSHKL